MIELNKIYQENCFDTMKRIDKVDLVLTSPPYNTARSNCDFYNDTNKSRYSKRYEDFNDMKTDEEYIQWTVDLFNAFDKILARDGAVCYNISYGGEKPWLMWNVMSQIQMQTNFRIADCIVWKKKSALPNNVSPNKLTRICEFVFVLCRESEMATFFCNKGVNSKSEKGQTIYNNVFNYIDAPNNDETCPIHKATYSSLLCRKLIDLYCPPCRKALCMTRLWELAQRLSLAYEKKEIISVLNFQSVIANGLKTESKLKHHN